MKNESVVIVGAGLSTTKNKDKVIEYIKKNKSTVFAANYNFESIGIKSNYTYVTDPEKLDENLMKIKSHLILPSKLAVGYNKEKLEKFISKNKKNYNIYSMGIYNKIYTYQSNKILVPNKFGIFPYFSFGISGFGAILASSLCRPKKMLLVGIDAPKANVNFKIMYNNDRVKYEKPSKCQKVINYFVNILVPTIHNMGITIETYSSVELLGLDKKKLKVKVLS